MFPFLLAHKEAMLEYMFDWQLSCQLSINPKNIKYKFFTFDFCDMQITEHICVL